MSTMLDMRNEDLELLSTFSDTTFDLEYSIEQAKDILSVFESSHQKNSCTFESDQWTILNVQSGTFSHFKFDEIRNMTTFQQELDGEVLINAIKTWTVNQLSYYSVKTAYRNLNYLIPVLTHSNLFSSTENSKENVKNELYSRTELTKFRICTTALNFLDFYDDVDDQMFYTKLLNEISEEVDIKQMQHIRELPSPRDVMIFDNLVNNFFSNIIIPSQDYFRYFPIYLWWNLTNIIPIRPSEFCTIKRDGLFKKNGEFYIQLPRSSKGNKLRNSRNRNRIQIIDTIRISSELGDKVHQYIELTEPFGSSQTLISYLAWENAGTNISNTGKAIKESYSLTVFRNILNAFHQEIIQGKYGVSVRPSALPLDNDVKVLPNDAFDISRSLRPGDTRHFAFINLMRQGFHPLEIARLGGHLELRTQYHYHQHVDYFMDTEILKLMSRFRLQHQYSLNKKVISGSSIVGRGSYTDTEFKKKFVFKPSVRLKTRKKLEMGYCIEPFQNCPVDECLMCDFWRIDVDEYNEKKEKIKARIAEVYDDTKKLMAMLLNLHKYIIENHPIEPDTSENSLSLNKDLATFSKQLDDALIKVSQLNMLEERKVSGRGDEYEK